MPLTIIKAALTFYLSSLTSVIIGSDDPTIFQLNCYKF